MTLLPSAEALIQTYDGYGRAPLTVVKEYQQVIEWQGEHPNKGSSAASRALDLPRGRIRPWFNGSKPDPVRAIQTAESNGWLNAEHGERVFEALALLNAWIFAGGSIDRERYVPAFAIGESDPEDILTEALQTVGVGVRVSREASSDRARELVPKRNAPVLGRYLHVLSAPVGEKGPDSDLALPTWLTDASFETRLRWARTYVTLRGTERVDRPSIGLQLAEKRAPEYLDELAAFFTELVDDDASVRRSGTNLYFSQRAAAMLDVEPELPDE